jgi:nitroimidazol reductase NimA-like FMN-containing flavoprotein (pyridoxamine 5'-phosphate oxidase superfamily)
MPDPVPQTWQAAAAVLDAAPICHVAFVADGMPRVLPATHGRVGATIYFHGSPAGGVIGAAASGAPLCISAVVLDGVVVAHSACHSGLNYRSVLITGVGREVEDPAEAAAALRAITERVTPGGWERGRPPRPEEIGATAVAAVAVTGFTIRARSGPSREDEHDRGLAGWSGVVPLRLQAGPAEADPWVPPETPAPPVLPDVAAPPDPAV